jgi:hypothetical protein
MDQAQARERARQISADTGRIAVADTVRQTETGIVRGGWPSADQTWAVFDYETGHLIEVDHPGTPR